MPSKQMQATEMWYGRDERQNNAYTVKFSNGK